MAEIVLFHHAGGLTDGVAGFAQVLRDAGHEVHTPDLFEGRTFADVREGMAYADSVGEEAIAARATEIAAPMPRDLVYGGLSMGAARAAEQVLARPGARAAFFLYGAVAPSWWGATWPTGVRSQAHVTAGDEFREPAAEAEYVSEVVGGELFVYPVSGHLFAETGHPDHDADAAALATERVLAFLAEV
jgi:dienelactone hydrolase